jgi:hypothetical protein
MRRAAKVDKNQQEIVAAFRKLGATVQDLSAVGKGVPDLLIGWRGVNYLVEVKRKPERGKVKPSECKLTEAQVVWHGQWKGQVCIVNCVSDVVGLLNS